MINSFYLYYEPNTNQFVYSLRKIEYNDVKYVTEVIVKPCELGRILQKAENFCNELRILGKYLNCVV